MLHVEADPYEDLTDEHQRHVDKYLDVRPARDGWTISKRARYAGLLQVGRTVYWLEPPFSAASFVYLLLRHQGMKDAADRAYAAASNRRDRSFLELMRVLAATMVTESERLAAGHIAQSYVNRTERTGFVRGRPLWHRQGGRPPDGTVMCKFDEKSTDTLANRLVLAGLDAASRWTDTGSERAALRTQQHVWRSLAEPVRPAPHDFDIAELRLNRLTRGYRSAIAIARALLFGFDLASPDPNTHIYAPVFDLAELFETLVLLVAELAAVGTGKQVDAQTSERRAIVTRSGQTYRRIRPDVLVSEDDVPVLVLDSKFKPRYGSGGRQPTGEHRISREDIFQIFFYANRIAQRRRLSSPIPAAIAAPLLGDSEPPTDEYRQLHWGEDSKEVGARLTLVLIPVDDAVNGVHRNDSTYCRGLFAETDLF
jgi:hypothetical protein